jgi:hypothetical protein
VEDQIKKEKLYKDISKERIGIPQGGALSGLIANIVLHEADKKILETNDNDLFYVRFCDDMICIHPKKIECKSAVDRYKNKLLELKLVPHKFEDKLLKKPNSFWSSKSKSVYKWSSIYGKPFVYQWIGFVGYELHFNGSLRVRKSSLLKEVNKQKEVINRLILCTTESKHRKNKGYILESARNKLNGMSVGRISMWNHSKVDAEMCWVNGFTELNDNQTLRQQLRYLDSRRNHQIARLKRNIKHLEKVDPSSNTARKKIHYGRPFSYYYQTLKNK